MKPSLKISAAVFVFGFAACAAQAETVTISTYYPSPYGSYQTLETNTLQGSNAGADPLVIAPGAGNVGIGGAAGASKLTVTGAGNATVDLRVNGRIHTGDAGGNGGVYLDNASTQFVGQSGTSMGLWNNGWRLLVTNAGDVGIGAAPGAGLKLDVVGDARANHIRLATNAVPNNGQSELQVDCNGGNCYALAVYA